MSVSLADVCDVVEELWPREGAEAWDAPGLLSGDPHSEISAILLAVDAVADTVGEAVQARHDLLLVHHPLLLRGVTSVSEDRYKGAMLARLIRGGCALIAAHTNADVVADGTSAVLAERLGLTETRPIVPGTVPGTGLGRVGHLDQRTTLASLAELVSEALPATAGGVKVAGDPERPVMTVSLCGGAGDSLLRERAVVASDVYITSDLRHHPASEAREQARLGVGPALVDVSHWASESLWLDTAAAQLRTRLPGVRVDVSSRRTDPWDFAVMP